jgi:hypothetical protein
MEIAEIDIETIRFKIPFISIYFWPTHRKNMILIVQQNTNKVQQQARYIR